IGEIWFAGPADLPLLAKYIFTSERLSIQVHPNDTEAQARGLERGKSECWLVLEAEPDAQIGLGLTRSISGEELRSSALDGGIEQLMDWRPVRSGDFLYVPAGTVHAIGAGISLLEFQQNADATFRLYDYGRPRELHLDDAVAVSRPGPYPAELGQHILKAETRVLVSGPHFSLVHIGRDGEANDYLADRRRWVLPLAGLATAGGVSATPGECLLVEPGEPLQEPWTRMLVGAAGELKKA
ncbi:MAG TPA: class I mannose-6-phosphate isomerase, partial [Sphingomicrobium sp.]|nr:class I mannose-6-phosphate isomerase [Sphingomicrobium sp.]